MTLARLKLISVASVDAVREVSPAPVNSSDAMSPPVLANGEMERRDVVAFSAVKFWRVVEPTTVKSPRELMVVVAVAPT